ncbi:general odorant-binding protein 56a [Fopius arisanus]|uniref:General odorant-binding protein 56a n=1 Tax=Fopius arisanus TaxID=64838 RepID=A0A0C9PK74_9HYME|nr:PREDICTED: general odorant-binding protein 56a-like [Fopius arisanus]
MKVFLVLFSVCLAAVMAQQISDIQKETLRENRDACITETGADRAEVDNAYKNEWVDNEKLRCFALCLLKKWKMMDDQGKLDETMARERMGKVMPPAKVDELMTKCKDLKGSNPCETGYMMMKCYTGNIAPAAV